MSAPTSPQTPRRVPCQGTPGVLASPPCTPTVPETPSPSPRLVGSPAVLLVFGSPRLPLSKSIQNKECAPSHQLEAPPAAPSMPTAKDYMLSADDVTSGKCWYDVPWLKDRAREIKKELGTLAVEELDKFIEEYDRVNNALDERYLDNLLSPRLDECARFMAAGEDYGTFLINRMKQYKVDRCYVRHMAIQAQAKVLANKIDDSWAWWASTRSGAPGKRRRLEMGLHGLNPKGKARGAGGGL